MMSLPMIFGRLLPPGTSKHPMQVHKQQVYSKTSIQIYRNLIYSQQVVKAPTDALHTLEHTTTILVSSIMSEQTSSSSIGGPTILSISPTVKPHITLPTRNITLSELQRCKRQFVTAHKKAIVLGTTEKGNVNWSEESVAQKFVEYLEENLKP